MNSITKSIITGLLLMMFFSIIGTRVNIVTNRQIENELSYALRVATQDATFALVDRNHMMDGKEGDTGNFRVNMDTAEQQCPDYIEIGSQGNFETDLPSESSR